MEWNSGWFALVMVCLFGGLIAGFLLCRKLTKREMQKNPPVNEQMIRAMFMSMGRKPSEAQIRQVMNSMKNSQN